MVIVTRRQETWTHEIQGAAEAAGSLQGVTESGQHLAVFPSPPRW